MLTQGVGASVVVAVVGVAASARRARLSLGNAATREADAAARRISGMTEPVIIMRRDFCIREQSKAQKSARMLEEKKQTNVAL